MDVIIEELSQHQDERGTVVEPLMPEQISAQRNVHVVLTQPGCIRGNHYHRDGTEYLTVYGPALVRLRQQQETKDVVLSAAQVVRFIIPPGISHAIKNTGQQVNLSIAFNTVAHDPAAPDTVRDVLLT